LEEIDATAEEEEDAGVEAVEEGLISHRYQLRPQSAVTINLLSTRGMTHNGRP
jgi:hypothetical protein